MQELAKYKEYDVRTLQTEDEIAACVAALGASFAGAIGATGTSGPGFSLMAEGLGLAVMTELPMVCINVQRAGPSTGMPTKTEQADLLMAMHGRHGECPLVVLAAATPVDCFQMAFEAVRLAIKYMTPVLLLSDSFLANSAEPWRVIAPDELPDLRSPHLPAKEDFAPYRRDPETLSRTWAAAGTPGFEHRIGGLEKEDVTGGVTYDAANHQRMVSLRAQKIAGIARDIPPAQVDGPTSGRSAGGWLGQHLWRDCRRRRRSAARRTPGCAFALAVLTSLSRQSKFDSPQVQADSCSREQHGAASQHAP